MRFRYKTRLLDGDTEVELASLNCILYTEKIEMSSPVCIRIYYLEPVYERPEDEQSYRIP